MTKLFYTYNLLLKHNACEDGLKAVLAAHPDLIEHPDREINILDLLETNSVNHCIWALRATTTDSREVSVEIAKRATARSIEYISMTPRKVDDVFKAPSEADFIAYRAFSQSIRINHSHKIDFSHSACAGRACGTTYDALFYASKCSKSSSYTERYRQKSDLLELLDY